MRGNLPSPAPLPPPVGSIPARAGEPTRPYRDQGHGWVYPRACGGTSGPTACGCPGHGLSPRVRGNPPDARARSAAGRSIPARAGEPAPGICRRSERRVYPRACGGTPTEDNEPCPATGLSPRVRGNRNLAAGRAGAERWVYPRACGGTGIFNWISGGVRVYPRACGGTGPRNPSGIPARAGEPAGNRLSPRVRGNPVSTASGSIPARAGERPDHAQQRVYPRACGGTGISRLVVLPTMGLSPRVRGNPVSSTGSPATSGSIPARAGEPVLAIALLVTWRSIPARAGEPATEPECSGPRKVYPRACGGTTDNGDQSQPTGVYPRACGGTVRRVSARSAGTGSIPARAGEPATAFTGI